LVEKRAEWKKKYEEMGRDILSAQTEYVSKNSWKFREISQENVQKQMKALQEKFPVKFNENYTEILSHRTTWAFLTNFFRETEASRGKKIFFFKSKYYFFLIRNFNIFFFFTF
jgi:hypothetical protein